jgi:methylmalonyl-CoA/ethylmalonyl-CoA epimerase
MKVREVDHICFAVNSVEEARQKYEKVLGLEPALEYVSDEESIKVVRYYAGPVAIEIMEPTREDSEVGRFLKRRGEGFFLISYRVDDVEQSLEELREKGERTIDTKPREMFGNRYAFINPPSEMHGALIEILDGGFEPGDRKKE